MLRRAFSIQWMTALAIIGLMLILASVLLWHGARGADRILIHAVKDTGRQLAVTTEERSRRLIDPARVVLRMLAHDNLGSERFLADRLGSLPLMAAALDAHEVASAVYIGYDNGDFLLLRRSARLSKDQLSSIEGAESARYLVQSVARDPAGRRFGEWRLYDADLTMVGRRVMPDYDFDPRTRPWYREALAAEGERLTQPYVFFTTREIGVTLSLREQTGRAVVGAGRLPGRPQQRGGRHQAHPPSTAGGGLGPEPRVGPFGQGTLACRRRRRASAGHPERTGRPRAGARGGHGGRW